jgi:hypothetical protein
MISTLLTQVVTDALNQFVIYTCIKKSGFIGLFYGTLKYYINKNSRRFRRYKKTKIDAHYCFFIFLRTCQITIKFDRQR